jgi:hypothetical protein
MIIFVVFKQVTTIAMVTYLLNLNTYIKLERLSVISIFEQFSSDTYAIHIYIRDFRIAVCLLLCLNPCNSETNGSIFSKRSVLEREHFWLCSALYFITM